MCVAYEEEKKGDNFKIPLCAFVYKFIEIYLCFCVLNIAAMWSTLCTVLTVMWADWWLPLLFIMHIMDEVARQALLIQEFYKAFLWMITVHIL